jgi:hypothetical protein
MTHGLEIILCATLSAGFILASSSKAVTTPADPSNQVDEKVQPDSSAAVAYVYVARPTHIDGFAAAANGKLTPVPGSPYANFALSHMSVNKKFLFGIGNNGDIYSFSIASDGALKLVATTNALKLEKNCSNGYAESSTIDYTGSTLYLPVLCDGGNYLQSYRIESDGYLQYLGGSENRSAAQTPIFLGTNKYAYAYTTDCDDYADKIWSVTYKRESNGFLSVSGSNDIPMPADPPAGSYYCPEGMAGDTSNHLAIAVQAWRSEEGPSGIFNIATYTADAKGRLTTESTQDNMTFTDQSLEVAAMSIDPTGKHLAVGGSNGFQVFQFKGGAQVSGNPKQLQPDESFGNFAWDRSGHLYATTYDVGLYVYNVTATGVTQAPGSPYPILEAESVIVLSK